MIKITDLARQKVKAAMEAEKLQGRALRITVQRGGTPNVQYGLMFDEEAKKADNDTVVDAGDFKILMDAQSAHFLEGATLDYISTLNGSGFKITMPSTPLPPTPKLDSPEALAIQKLIDEKINPGVAAHGGHVALVDVKDNMVYLRLGGGCQGCGMVNVTLKQGIEVMIKKAVPAIKGVLDVTDHAGGKNPYYQPSK
jgi:Fe/S biogenesis protein NfuA